MRAAFITVGDTSRLTGGYLYHARVFDGLEDFGVGIEEIVASGASVEEQRYGVSGFASSFDPRGFDVVVVDALARVVCAPLIEGWRRHRPVVAMVHELPSFASPAEDSEKERGFEEALLRGSDLFLAVSGHGKSVLEDRGVPPGMIRIVSPGSDGLASKTVTGGARRRQGSQAICVAQWIPRKGILELVEAWRGLDFPDASLQLVGDTDADRDYTLEIKSAAFGDSSIQVSGVLDAHSLASAYADSDFFVLPSSYEGYGVVYAEALSFGLPIIACDVGPVPELVGEEAALLVPTGDPERLRRALRSLISDEDLRLRMSEAALRRAENLPRWEDARRGFAEVLREAAGRG